MSELIDHRHLVRVLAIGRIGLGLALVLLPRRIGGAWIGSSARRPGAALALRGIGARDLALGWGVLRALDRGDPSLADWVAASALADLGDTAATLLAYPGLPRSGRRTGLLLAATAAVVSLGARRRLS